MGSHAQRVQNHRNNGAQDLARHEENCEWEVLHLDKHPKQLARERGQAPLREASKVRDSFRLEEAAGVPRQVVRSRMKGGRRNAGGEMAGARKGGGQWRTRRKDIQREGGSRSGI